MIKPRRIGHATFQTPDLEKAIAYYTQTMGLVLAARERERAFLASKIGLLTIVIEHASAERCARSIGNWKSSGNDRRPKRSFDRRRSIHWDRMS